MYLIEEHTYRINRVEIQIYWSLVYFSLLINRYMWTNVCFILGYLNIQDTCRILKFIKIDKRKLTLQGLLKDIGRQIKFYLNTSEQLFRGLLMLYATHLVDCDYWKTLSVFINFSVPDIGANTTWGFIFHTIYSNGAGFEWLIWSLWVTIHVALSFGILSFSWKVRTNKKHF